MDLFILMVFGIAGGIFGRKLPIPLGTLFGAMSFTAVANSCYVNMQNIPSLYIFSLQVVAGALIGQELNSEFKNELKKCFIPSILSASSLIVIAIILMVTLNRFFYWDYATAWLAMCPGRMADMIIISGTINADSFKVFAAHLIRQLSVIIFTPMVLGFKYKEKNPDKQVQ